MRFYAVMRTIMRVCEHPKDDDHLMYPVLLCVSDAERNRRDENFPQLAEYRMMVSYLLCAYGLMPCLNEEHKLGQLLWQ